MPDATLVGLEIFSKLLEERSREREAEKQRGLQMLSMQAEERESLMRNYQGEQQRQDVLLGQLTELSRQFAEVGGMEASKRLEELGGKEEYKIKTDLPNLVGIAKKNVASQIGDIRGELSKVTENINRLRSRIVDISDEPLWGKRPQEEWELKKRYTESMILENKAQAAEKADQERKMRRYERVETISALKEQIKGYDTTLAKYRDEFGNYDLTTDEAKQTMDAKNAAIGQLELLSKDLMDELGIQQPVKIEKPKPSWY